MVNLNQAIILLIIVTIATGQACTTANPGCNACVNATSTLCTGCHAGFGFDSFAKTCTACANMTYSDVSNATDLCISCNSTAANCATCSPTTGVCTSCRAGFFFNGTDNTCNLCAANTFSSGGTAASCSSCLNAICTSCQSTTGNCTGCAAGYGFVSIAPFATACSQCVGATYSLGGQDTCAPCNTSDCATCSSVSGQCASCTPGRGWTASPPSCATCGTGNFSLGGTNACVVCTVNAGGIVGCTTCNTTNFCTACAAAYAFQNNGCSPCGALTWAAAGSTSCANCPNNCSTCTNTTGVCTACQNGFVLSTANNNCTMCTAGTFKGNGDTSACTSCTLGTNCLTCNYITGACSSCTPGFGLQTNGTCTPCGNGTFSAGNSPCAPCPSLAANPGCATCNNTNGNCSGCYPGFHWSNSRQNCSVCFSNTSNSVGGQTNCIACASVPGTPASCATCNSVNGTCNSCLPANFWTAATNSCALCSPGTWSGGVQNATCINCTVTGCLSCDQTNGTCLMCAAGYSLGTPCVACLTGFYALQNSTSCTNCTINGCASCNVTTGVCTGCLLGNHWSNSGRNCSVCFAGTFNSVGGTTKCTNCTTLNLNCSTCDRFNGSCTGCRPGNRWNPGTQSCIYCTVGTWSPGMQNTTCTDCLINGCAVCDITNGNCLSCQPGYRWDPLGLNCTACGPSNFSIGGNATVCLPCSANNCNQCVNTTGACLNCFAGNGFNATDGTCTQCVEHFFALAGTNPCRLCVSQACATCSRTTGACLTCQVEHGFINHLTTCVLCTQGFFSLGGTNATCSSCTTFGVTCNACNKTDGACTSCLPGFGWSPTNTTVRCTQCPPGTYSAGNLNACQNCTTTASGCATCNVVTGVCSSCRPGFGWNSTTNTCSPCGAGLHSNGGISACMNCSILVSDPSCQTCSQINNTCTGTFPAFGWVSANRTGVACPNGQYSFGNTNLCAVCTSASCLACQNTTGVCTNCAPGYQFNALGAILNDCSACITGFYSTGGNMICTLCAANGCATCNSANGFCQSCSPGYRWNNNNTIINGNACTLCSIGTYSLGNLGLQCLTCIDSSCATCSLTTGVCQSCNAGYNWNNLNVILSNACTLCLAGTFSLGGTAQCQSCINAQCASCNPRTGFCTSCQPGHRYNGSAILSENVCIPCLAGQFSLGGQAICSSCSSLGFPGCASCDPTNDRCLSCFAGFYYVSSTRDCIPCQDGFYSFGNTAIACNACNIDGCATCNVTTGVCLGCQTGYGWNSTTRSCSLCALRFYSLGATSVCLACSTNCTSCVRRTGFCSSCIPGHGYNSTSTSINTVCSACAVNTFSLGGTNFCVSCISVSCATCSPDSGRCRSCNAGYEWVSHNRSCILCPSRYFALAGNNVCAVCTSASCSICQTTTGRCLACNPGYGFNSATNLCTACPVGQFSLGGTNTCGICTANCAAASCMNTTGRCSACVPGFTILSNNTCYNCALQNRYSFGRAACDVCTDNCRPGHCNAATGVCSACLDGYSFGFVINQTFNESVNQERRHCVDDSKAGTLVGSIVAGSVAAFIILIVGIIVAKSGSSAVEGGSAGYYGNQPNSNVKLNDGIQDRR